ncbi:hypothetical protein L2E82_50355 [Cichorium intybus]|nr:hypothetical protein L2E82_50355 [Cichorium intybus]
MKGCLQTIPSPNSLAVTRKLYNGSNHLSLPVKSTDSFSIDVTFNSKGSGSDLGFASWIPPQSTTSLLHFSQNFVYHHLPWQPPTLTTTFIVNLTVEEQTVKLVLKAYMIYMLITWTSGFQLQEAAYRKTSILDGTSLNPASLSFVFDPDSFFCSYCPAYSSPR